MTSFRISEPLVRTVLMLLFILPEFIQSSRPCLSIHETEGKCVEFEVCPPFLELLKSEPLTPDKLRLLQRLTCAYDKDVPKICCPVTEITDGPVPGQGSGAGIQTQSQDKLKPVTGSHGPGQGGQANGVQQIKPKPKPSPSPSGAQRNPALSTSVRPPYPPSGVQIDTNDRSQIDRHPNTNYGAHPNFNLIPHLKDCSNAINTDRIVGGKDAPPFGWPWMARIGYLNLETNEIEFYCGGTIINKRYILSASHCTEEIDDEYTPVVIRVGEHDVSTDEDCSPYLGCVKAVDYVIEKVIPHSNYQKDDKSNDIELIRVNRDISFESFAVRPVCLPFPKEYGILSAWNASFADSKTKAWVTGWGRTKWNQAEGSNILQEVQLPLISNDQCQYNYSKRVEISEKQICAGGVKAKDSCGGDSGGPLVFPVTLNGEGKFFQLGVVSFGPVQCGVGGLPGVYTRISRYLDWILNNMEP